MDANPGTDGGRHDAENRDASGATTRELRTDGGASANDEGPEGRPMAALFVDVTGTETLVERRSTPSDARQVGEGEGTTVAEDASAVARNDGLSDAIPDPGADGAPD